VALIRFGVIKSFDKDVYQADVEIIGYHGTYIESVPVALSVREDLVTEGARCVILFFDEINPSDAVVLALFGGRPAEDPLFDPVVGHRHRGMVRDGPKL